MSGKKKKNNKITDWLTKKDKKKTKVKKEVEVAEEETIEEEEDEIDLESDEDEESVVVSDTESWLEGDDDDDIETECLNEKEEEEFNEIREVINKKSRTAAAAVEEEKGKRKRKAAKKNKNEPENKRIATIKSMAETASRFQNQEVIPDDNIPLSDCIGERIEVQTKALTSNNTDMIITSGYPTKDIGFHPNIQKVLEDRKKDADEMGVGTENIEIIVKHFINLKMTRFIPCYCYGKSQTLPAKYKKIKNEIERANVVYTKPSKLCCLWCTEQISSVPVPMAHKYHNRQVRKLGPNIPGYLLPYHQRCEITGQRWWFTVSGLYCSPSCAMSAARAKNAKLVPLTRLMFKKVYGIGYFDKDKKCIDIPFAPPKEALQKYGGPMTIEQFRGSSRLNLEYKFVELPLFPMSVGIEEIERSRETFTHVADPDLIESICKHGTSYRSLKRNGNSVPPLFGNNNHKKNTRKRGPRKKGYINRRANNKRQQRSSWSNNGAPPTVEQQLQESAERLRQQREELSCVTRKKNAPVTLLNFMTLQSDD